MKPSVIYSYCKEFKVYYFKYTLMSVSLYKGNSFLDLRNITI